MFDCLVSPDRKRHCMFPACGQAIETYHTPGKIKAQVVRINAFRLADIAADATLGAATSVNLDAEQGNPGK
jgi:hypothetical protein